MTITTTQLDLFKSDIENAVNETGRINAIGNYYQYLANNDIEYGLIGKAVATEGNAYGEFAMNVLRAAGANDAKVDAVRTEIALTEIGRASCRERVFRAV